MARVHLLSAFAATGALFVASQARATVTVSTVSTYYSVDPGSAIILQVQCPSGSKAVGGGWYGNPDNIVINQSRVKASSSYYGWGVIGSNISSVTDYLTVYARCASGLPSGAVVYETRFLGSVDANTQLGMSAPQCNTDSIQTAVGFASAARAASLSRNQIVFDNRTSTTRRTEFDSVCIYGLGSSARVDDYTSTTLDDLGWGYGRSGVTCPSGTVATGGGYDNWGWLFNGLSEAPYYSSSDSDYPNGWTIYIDYWLHTDQSARAIAFCTTFP
jgi:hypothetical protein